MRWEPLTEKKFKTQLYLVLLIVGVLVIAGSLLYVSYQKNLTTEKSQQSISAITTLKVEQLTQWNEERLSEVTFFSTSPPVLRFALPVIAGETEKETQLRNTLRHILSNNRYDDIALLDKNGKLLFSVMSTIHTMDTSNKYMLDSMMRSRNIVFRDFYTCPYDGRTMVCYLAPVMDNRSVIVAGMLFLIDPNDYFYPHIKKWPVPSSTAETYLVKRAPNAIDFLSPMAGLKQDKFPYRSERDSLDDIALFVQSGKVGFIEGKDSRGVAVMAFSQPVPGTDWILISKVSKNELFADYFRISVLAFLFGLTLLLLLWGGIVWVYKKRQQSYLLESEDKYRSLVNQMQVGLALHELILENGVPVNYRFLEVNPGFEKLTGLSREQLVGKTVLEVMPDTEPFWIEKYGRVVQDGKPNVFENFSSVLGKYYSVTAYPVGSMQFATIVDDITERKRMMNALRSSEQSYRDLIDNINDTIWIVDKDGKLMDVNKEVTIQLGYSKEEILQIGVKGIDATLSEEEILHINEKILAGSAQLFETIHRTKSGQLIPVEINAACVNYMGQQMAVCIARDITQRKRAEGFQHLLYEIARFTTGSGTFDELLALVRNELGKVMDATNFYVAIYQEATNSLDALIFVNEKYSALSWTIDGTLSGHVFKTGKSVLLCSEKRHDFLQQNGIKEVENLPTCWLGVPLSNGETTIGVLVLQDYSDQHAYDKSNLQILEMVAHELSVVIQRQRMINDLIGAKEKAEESDRLKTAFLANVSHEIRTPMNGILGFIEMLSDPETDSQNRAEYMDIVSKSGQRLLATIDDIIEISRIEAGLIELHPSDIDLAETMAYQLSFFQVPAQEKGIVLELKENLKGQEALVTVDKFKLHGILSNLLNNAMKFTHKGSILFGNALKDGQLLFYVSDTGIGIPPDRQEAIFQRFVQADLTSTRPYEGSGLGLSIVKAYLDKMGGRIWLESEPSTGSTFYFTLPYKPVKHSSIPKAVEKPVETTNAETMSILVAEDDAISFVYLETLLKREGFHVYHASNGLEAVELAGLHPEIDAILMDIKMPEMNGLEATRKIRQFNQQVPIIAQSAFAFAGDMEEALLAGCTDYLTKPTSREKLLTSLQPYIIHTS